MTLFAGAYSLQYSTDLPPALIQSLENLLTRNGSPQYRARYAKFFAVKHDVGAFTDGGWLQNNDSVTAVCGNPLHGEDSGNFSERYSSVLAFDRSDFDDWNQTAARCNGTYSAFKYDQRTHKLAICTDALGARPVYFTVVDSILIFSSTLRLLEKMPEIIKTVSARGLTEQYVLGYQLDGRTPYSNISILRSGETLHAEESKMARSFHTLLAPGGTVPDPKPQAAANEKDHCRALHGAFLSALRSRLTAGQPCNAFLSGGLDSRIIVGGLNQIGAKVRTVCFGEANSQDVVYSSQFAKKLQIDHFALPGPSGPPVWGSRARDAIEAIKSRSKCDPGRFLFSGDGGSVGIGYVYFDDRVVENLIRGDLISALKQYINRWGAQLPRWILKSEFADKILKYPAQGFLEEMSRPAGQDHLRAYHLFLMYNDQKRHLADFYEAIDMHQIEYQLPFYDLRVLRLTQSAPVEFFLKHKLYYNLLNLFPPATGNVPWQAYPEHLPCPLEPGGGDSTSWQFTPPPLATTFVRTRAVYDEFLQNVRTGSFPSAAFSKRALLAIPLRALRLNDMGYFLKGLNLFSKHLAISNGAIEFE